MLLLLAYRQIFSKYHDTFTRSVQRSAIMAIAFAVCVVSVVMSVFNGFYEEITFLARSHPPEIKVQIPIYFTNAQYDRLSDRLSAYPGVVALDRQLEHFSVIFDGQIKPSRLLGVDDQSFASIMKNDKIKCPKSSIKASFPRSMVDTYGLSPGDALSFYTFDRSHLKKIATSGAKSLSSLKPKMVSVCYCADHQADVFEPLLSQSIILSSTLLAKALGDMKALPSDLVLTIDLNFDHHHILQLMASEFPDLSATLSSHSVDFLLSTLSMQKKMMFAVLFLLVITGLITLVNATVMLVKDRASEIALLQTMGISHIVLYGVYMLHALVIASIGLVFGLGSGVWLAYHLADLVSFAERLGGFDLAQTVFILPYLPTKVYVSDLLWIAFFVLLSSLLSVFWPLFSALKVKPSEVLRYE